MICAGIDAGSRAIKIVLMDADTLEVKAAGIADQGMAQEERAGKLLERLMKENGIKPGDISRTVATGYGRNKIAAAETTITEITCHAVGVRHEIAEAMTVIDIGGQDSKLMRLNTDGTVRDFEMNDRCAAGTGCFLEVVSTRLGVKLEDIGKLIEKSRQPANISSMCVVFAETEIVGLLSEGTPPQDIAAGVQNSIATRVGAMAGRNITAPIIFTGGVALIGGMERALESALGQSVAIAPQPQLTGALGAAILAVRQLNGKTMRTDSKYNPRLPENGYL